MPTRLKLTLPRAWRVGNLRKGVIAKLTWAELNFIHACFFPKSLKRASAGRVRYLNGLRASIIRKLRLGDMHQ